MLPISADSQDTALTIFSTLNNRGLPLSDADIFKAKIYNNLTDGEKDGFIEQWKTLEKEAVEAHESIQQLFYYYMFYLRAKEGDVSSTTPGIRKFYSANKFARLYEPDLMDELRTVLNLWKVINTNQDIPSETWDNKSPIRNALDTLNSYPNEYWKYPVITYYMAHRKEEDFDNKFLLFLNKLSGELMMRFILFPTINAVKGDIMKLNAKIINDAHPDFSFRAIDTKDLEERIRLPHRNIVRMLLKTYAYDHQQKLLPDNWQIEHILPQRWQMTFFPGVPDEEVEQMVEHIGNKTPFERKLNIVASNGYFMKKQSEYQKSEIEITKSLVSSISGDWTLQHIEHRDKIVSEEIMRLLQIWNENYTNTLLSTTTRPSKDELEMIEKFKKNGWV